MMMGIEIRLTTLNTYACLPLGILHSQGLRKFGLYPKNKKGFFLTSETSAGEGKSVCP